MNIHNPVKGKLVALEEVSDPVFSQKMMGDGVAIIPSDTIFYAPISGTLTSVFPTYHAFGITSEDGVELLIHIGIDTVNLKGKYFKSKVKQGDQVTLGDILVEVDIEAVKAEGYDMVTPVVILDQSHYSDVSYQTDFQADALEKIIYLD